MENRDLIRKVEQLDAKLLKMEQQNKTRRFFHLPSTVIGIFVASLTLALWSYADTPDNITQTSFTSGTVISSSNMNSNFTAVFNAVNELLKQIQVKSGKVGIGTTSAPAYKLDVNGDTNVNGTMQIKDVVPVTDSSYDLGSSTKKMKKVYTVDVSLPPGLIMPSSVPGHNTTPPTGWLFCDGSAVSRTTYAELYSAIGTTYGIGDGSTTFNLPDYRGYFLRGIDNSAGSDPDAGSRTNRGDGVTGDNVGTKQASNVQSSSARVYDFDGRQLINSIYGAGGNGQNSGFSVTGSSGTYGVGDYGNRITIGSGTDTRPKNISVVYLIKY
ncbi:MAG: tail fiber protein [SAR324 cluster bacterium]|nr:tail fiber protein [SAR324 cluster bacterium]